MRLVDLQVNMRNQLLDERVSMTVIRTAELLFNTPYVSATSLAEALNVTFPTAQSAIDHLVDRGDLIETTGRKRNRFYFAQGIFDAVYGTTEKPSEEQSTLLEAQ
ncbi:MAG: hypothetical protein M5U31_04405 [Acidimicrobiia bacterium]|nr:hypothetical protein [Acidimicrobiia bacterium]